MTESFVGKEAGDQIESQSNMCVLLSIALGRDSAFEPSQVAIWFHCTPLLSDLAPFCIFRVFRQTKSKAIAIYRSQLACCRVSLPFLQSFYISFLACFKLWPAQLTSGQQGLPASRILWLGDWCETVHFEQDRPIFRFAIWVRLTVAVGVQILIRFFSNVPFQTLGCLVYFLAGGCWARILVIDLRVVAHHIEPPLFRMCLWWFVWFVCLWVR